ncbi:MAG: hypothetical protein ACKOD2_00210 [Ilumatobacteraceae bacterium]
MKKNLLAVLAVTAAAVLPSSLSSAESSQDDGRWKKSAGFPLQEKSLVAAGDELGLQSAGYTFVPINPYRAFDSRGLPYYLQGGYTNRFDVLTDEYGNSQIPYGVVAVTYNLTVTSTFGEGFFSIYPVDIYWPGTSSINWTSSGQTIANGGVVAIGDYGGVYGGVEVYVGPNRPGVATDYIVDITGYFI